jgi:hypothetical protein
LTKGPLKESNGPFLRQADLLSGSAAFFTLSALSIFSFALGFHGASLFPLS